MKRVEKGWGYELWIHNDHLYCGKLMHFNADRKCSIHFHKLKHETFYLSTGRINVKYCSVETMLETLFRGGNISTVPFELVTLTSGSSLELPPWTIHQMYAEVDSDLYEFSTQHFDEDSYRLERGD